jgi:hypothetical protein
MQEKREGARDGLGGGPRPRPDKLTLPRPDLSLSIEIGLKYSFKKNKLYPLLPAHLSTSAP